MLDQVVVAVRGAIASGALAPGRRLTERELMELTGVSRTSIREAVRSLESLGLVEPTPRRGMRVAILGEAEVRHIYEVRDALEPAAVELFVVRATDEEVEQLPLLGLMAADHQMRLAAASQFDHLILAGCRNPILQGILEPLHVRIHALRAVSLTIPGRQAISTQEYVDLVTAIRGRDAEAAAAASHCHVRAAEAAALIAVEKLTQGAAADTSTDQERDHLPETT